MASYGDTRVGEQARLPDGTFNRSPSRDHQVTKGNHIYNRRLWGSQKKIRVGAWRLPQGKKGVFNAPLHDGCLGKTRKGLRTGVLRCAMAAHGASAYVGIHVLPRTTVQGL